MFQFLIPNKNTPRWIIFLIDLALVFLSYVVSYLVRFEFSPPKDEIDFGLAFLPWLLLIRAVFFYLGKTYSGIIRYTSTQDTTRIFTVLVGGSLVFWAMNMLRYYTFDELYFIPNSIIILEFIFTLAAMVISRISIKLLYMELKSQKKTNANALIYGAGEAGLIAKRTIDQDGRANKNIVGFIDDDSSKSGKTLEGVSIYHTSKSEELMSNGKIDELIISIQNLDRAKKAAIAEIALKHNVRVFSVPPVNSWINGELSVHQMRKLPIEDLLGRDAISLDNPGIKEVLSGKVVLITGAAGSIGSELVRQIVHYNPKQVIAFDQAESPLYDLQQELLREGKAGHCEFVIGDIRQRNRVKRLFDFFKPQIVFHAAAYKHVPLMEENPSEALLANVLGTKNLADCAQDFNVERFVMVSTDKAVNPTNVMGATKRLAEIYVKAKSSNGSTRFITTRFGNVLGSNGSVIPLFRRQIEEGGPLTVTHEEVTRYFMTIPEAVQLVLEASVMGQGGEIFVFDMGQSVKIIDLARKMIRLAGLEEGRDIQIDITGLRPGEKLYEELLTSDENTLPTHHPKIMIAKTRESDWEKVDKDVNALIELFGTQNNENIVRKIKELVPEYKSNNSEYTKLD